MVRRPQLYSLLVSALTVACALPSIDNNYTKSTSNATGGSSSNKTTSAGGASTVKTSGQGGSGGTAGASANRSAGGSGGESAASGGTSNGGTSSVSSAGGSLARGGSSSTGGTTSGGTSNSTTGGSNVAGGSAASGGTSLKPIGGATSGGTTNSATGGASIVGGTTASGGTSSKSSGGASSVGGTSAATSSAGNLVTLLADPWGSTTTGQPKTDVTVGALDSACYVLVAVVSNATDGAISMSATSVSYRGLAFTRLVGGSISGTAFGAEFWGARSPTVQLPSTLTVTTSAAGNTGVMVWALTNVNATNAVGQAISQRQFTGTTYQETFATKQFGSMLFGAFFDTNYAQDAVDGYLKIAANADSVVGQTYAGYYVWSASASSSGLQTISATLPESWTIEHVGIEIVP